MSLILDKQLERAIATNGYNRKRLEDPVFRAHSQITVKAALAAGWAEVTEPPRQKRGQKILKK